MVGALMLLRRRQRASDDAGHLVCERARQGGGGSGRGGSGRAGGVTSCMLGWRGDAVLTGVFSSPGDRAGRAARVSAQAPLAQSAERLHGKEKVYGSIP